MAYRSTLKVGVAPVLLSFSTLKESVALAFVAALQCLSARQRAVLLLRDVLGMSADETAHSLGTTVSGIDSTLYRARVATRARARDVGTAAREWHGSEVDDDLLRRYVRAWGAKDVAAFVALLHEDVVLNMPPSPTWLRGRDAVATFYATHAFAEPGTYFPALRVRTHRRGDLQTRNALIENLGRVRVVVE